MEHKGEKKLISEDEERKIRLRLNRMKCEKGEAMADGIAPQLMESYQDLPRQRIKTFGNLYAKNWFRALIPLITSEDVNFVQVEVHWQ